MPLLKTQIEKPKFSLEDIFEKEVHVYSKTIYCKALNKPNYALTIKEYEKQLNIIIDDLKDFNCPCLYWFSAESPESALILMEQLNQFRSSKHEHKRTLPAKNKNKNSNVIYGQSLSDQDLHIVKAIDENYDKVAFSIRISENKTMNELKSEMNRIRSILKNTEVEFYDSSTLFEFE
jgi:hypothetical protein